MVRASEARRIILETISPGSQEYCELEESYGRILAESVIAPHDVPGFDNSSMDGYAVRSNDLGQAGSSSPVHLTLQDEVSAGAVPDDELRERSAIRIMTGAPVPPGSDAVVEQELTEAKNGTVTVFSSVQSGRNIRARGDDIRAGTEVLQKGWQLTSARVGVLASLGITRLAVHRTPKVAVLTTGNELVPANTVPGPGQIRNSNAFSLTGLVRESGCHPVDLGIAKDDIAGLRAKIREGLRNDALITSGGVSVGKHDYVLQALESEGVEVRFWKVNIKPGKPFAYGIKRNSHGIPVPVFALPGNPVSSVVTFLQFVRYGLEKLKGNREFTPLRLTALLGEEIQKTDEKRHFMRGRVRNENGQLTVFTTGTQSSGVLTSLSQANCLLVVPEEARTLRVGSPVEIELL